MIISQLSVFMENKSGRLAEVLEVLGNEDLRITALSVADTTRAALREHKFTVNVTEVISVMVPDQARHYAKVLKILSDLDISVEYTYAFPTAKKSIIILKCSDNEKAIKALKDHEMELLRAGDLYRI